MRRPRRSCGVLAKAQQEIWHQYMLYFMSENDKTLILAWNESVRRFDTGTCHVHGGQSQLQRNERRLYGFESHHGVRPGKCHETRVRVHQQREGFDVYSGTATLSILEAGTRTPHREICETAHCPNKEKGRA